VSEGFIGGGSSGCSLDNANYAAEFLKAIRKMENCDHEIGYSMCYGECEGNVNVSYGGGTTRLVRYNYCPKCGAKLTYEHFKGWE
jgi:hypothetical protein